MPDAVIYDLAVCSFELDGEKVVDRGRLVDPKMRLD
jgi:hypothetical protein